MSLRLSCASSRNEAPKSAIPSLGLAKGHHEVPGRALPLDPEGVGGGGGRTVRAGGSSCRAGEDLLDFRKLRSLAGLAARNAAPKESVPELLLAPLDEVRPATKVGVTLGLCRVPARFSAETSDISDRKPLASEPASTSCAVSAKLCSAAGDATVFVFSFSFS